VGSIPPAGTIDFIRLKPVLDPFAYLLTKFGEENYAADLEFASGFWLHYNPSKEAVNNVGTSSMQPQTISPWSTSTYAMSGLFKL
jgi:hypothetical protein